MVTWLVEIKRIRGKKQPLSSAGLQALRDKYTRTIVPARALAAEALTLERTLSDLVNQAYALTPAEVALKWQTAPPGMPTSKPAKGLDGGGDAGKVRLARFRGPGQRWRSPQVRVQSSASWSKSNGGVKPV